MYEILDEGKFWNHSRTFRNSGFPPEGRGYCSRSTYALRDIGAGEELLDDYGTYDFPDWNRRLEDEFGIDHSFLDN